MKQFSDSLEEGGGVYLWSLLSYIRPMRIYSYVLCGGLGTRPQEQTRPGGSDHSSSKPAPTPRCLVLVTSMCSQLFYVNHTAYIIINNQYWNINIYIYNQ